jgi:NAD(P)-dependent dehydrogenase (short-subunit alcohol dehydrogenase family)
MDAAGTALVTGASRGIGRAVALELATRGFDVVATMRDPAAADSVVEQAADLRGTLELARLDVTDPAGFSVPDGLRVLVNNAGLDGAYLPIEHASVDEWRRLFETNLFAVLAMTRASLPAMRAAGGGVVCNVTSSSILVPMPLYGAYRASKAAASALGESLRAEVRHFGIRVLEVMPGPIDTDMLAESDRVPEAAALDGYEALAAYARAGRQGVADLVTPAPVAAARIVDAILDDDAPLRVGCDELADGLLAAWRAQPDEQWMRSLLP